MAMSAHLSLIEKSLEWIKVLKKIRPVWSPSTTGTGLGDFSIMAENSEQIVNFEILLENIHALQKNGKFEFLLIFDEFQEIVQVKRAEALLRSSLQKFSERIPIIILGSKQHQLAKIFQNPKAPFYSWGMTLEFYPIDYEEYHKYIEERFNKTQKTHSLETSIYLQDKLNRIPASVNRLCDYLVKYHEGEIITPQDIDTGIDLFVSRSRSMYEQIYKDLSSIERKIMEGVAKNDLVVEVLGKEFLGRAGNLAKSTVAKVVAKLLDKSILSYGIHNSDKSGYYVTDPLLNYFIKKYKS